MAAPTVTYAGASTFSDIGNANDTLAGVTWGAGDDIVVLGMTEDQTLPLGTPTATGLTFSALTNLPTTTATSCKGYGWSATAASSGSGTITSTPGGSSAMRGFAAWVVTAGTSDGLGTPAVLTNTTDTVSLTRGGSNSVVLWIGGDFNATNDTTVASVPAGGTQRIAQFVSGHATMFVFDWPDQGSTGTTSYGISGFTTTANFTKVAVEIKGTAGGGGGTTVMQLPALGVG